jgi:hypothetical protein
VEDLKILCDSSNKPTPKWMSASAVTLGSVLLYYAYWAFLDVGFRSKFVYNALLGVVCVVGAGISRRLYLSEVGIVRETRGWGRVIRRVLPWRDVKHVTLAYRGDMMMAFFEVGSTGWKVPFSRNQKGDVMGVIGEMLPDIELDTLGDR